MAMNRILINGRWVNSSSGQTFDSLNPANERPIGRFQLAAESDVGLAFDAAEQAFESWSMRPAQERAEILLRAAQLLRSSKNSLARLVTQEMGKVLPEALGDVQEAIDIAEYMAGEGRRMFGRTTPSELRDKFAMAIYRPVGVYSIITPWNFPVAIPAWKVMPALVCGNTLVMKPSSDTPLCAIRFFEILQKAGIPDGVINLVTGPGDTVGNAMIRHRKVRGISFTGHRSTGEHILREAGLKRIGLELGGKNGIIVMDDADLKLAVDGIIWGGYGTAGQRCTAASRVIAHEKIKPRLESMLLARIKNLRLGDGMKKTTDVGPLINQAAVEKTHRYTLIGREEGARLLCGGRKIQVNGRGFFYEPTLFTNATADMRIAQEEIFGPSVCIIEAKNLDHAIDIMNSVEYGLSSAIYTSDIKSAFRAIERIDAGLTYINSSTIGSEAHLPFGGVKATGNGTREAGWTGIEEFAELKTVYFDYSGRLQRAQIDNRQGKSL